MQQINTNEEWNTHGISQKKKLFYPTSYKKEKPAMSHEKRQLNAAEYTAAFKHSDWLYFI